MRKAHHQLRAIIGAIVLGFLLHGSAVLSQQGGMYVPVSGNTISIKGCKASPQILQVTEGTEITFKNLDKRSHTLFIDSKNIRLPAKGSKKIMAKFSIAPPVTMNYLCDGKMLPFGGAIYVVVSGQ